MKYYLNNIVFGIISLLLISCEKPESYYFLLPNTSLYVRVDATSVNQRLYLFNDITVFNEPDKKLISLVSFFNIRLFDDPTIYIDIPVLFANNDSVLCYGFRGDINNSFAKPNNSFIIYSSDLLKPVFNKAISIVLPINKEYLTYIDEVGCSNKVFPVCETELTQLLHNDKKHEKLWREWRFVDDLFETQGEYSDPFLLSKTSFRYKETVFDCFGKYSCFYINRDHPNYVFRETEPRGALSSLDIGHFRIEGQPITIVESDIISSILRTQSLNDSSWIKISSTNYDLSIDRVW